MAEDVFTADAAIDRFLHQTSPFAVLIRIGGMIAFFALVLLDMEGDRR